ncbi:hypothetical protein FXW78_12990 [Rhodococcus opacus]|nr:hypothetical protein [Rhodococcus opacus]
MVRRDGAHRYSSAVGYPSDARPRHRHSDRQSRRLRFLSRQTDTPSCPMATPPRAPACPDLLRRDALRG